MSDEKQGKPAPIFPRADQIPAELRSLQRWTAWRYKWNGHKFNKPPHSALTGEGIGATDKYADHRLNFDDAIAGAAQHQLDGVGFVFVDGDGFVGVDFDDCRDAATGALKPEVENCLREFPSFTEVSPSQTGVHVIVRGTIAKALAATPLVAGSASRIEMYASNRYFTVTGQRIGDVDTITDCQIGIDKVLQFLAPKTSASDPAPEKAKRPISKSTIRRIYADKLTALRNAPDGDGNNLINITALIAAKTFLAGVLDGTTESVQDEIVHIVTKEWKEPHDEAGARASIASGWSMGLTDPYTVRSGEVIVTSPGHVPEMIQDSEQVLHSIGLKYFERNNELVHTAYGRDVPALKDVRRAAESVVIIEASPQTIIRDLDQRATYVNLVEGKEGIEEHRVHVPRILPGHLHDRVHGEVRQVPYPTLNVVTVSPVLLPSGKASEQVFEEGVLFVPKDPGLFHKLPHRLTKADAQAALRQFDPIFEKFPFVDPGHTVSDRRQTASYAVVLAGVLSLVARPHLGLSAIPLFGVTAPARRSGKTKIVEAITTTVLGYKPTYVHFVDEEELGKHLHPLMRAGDRAILVDNVERSLQSAKLCILITGGVLKDRILGESRDVSLNNYAVLFATGNNLVVGGDLAARALRVDIDTRLERPEARSFDFDPVARAGERHPQLTMAALTALRAYVLAGTPWEPKRPAWGGFERWDRLISGCLTWAGYADPYQARERIMDADPIRTANTDLLEAWFSKYQNRAVSLNEIRRQQSDVYDMLLKENRWDGHHAQWLLRRLEGQVCNGYRLVRLDGRGRFLVEKMTQHQDTLPL